MSRASPSNIYSVLWPPRKHFALHCTCAAQSCNRNSHRINGYQRSRPAIVCQFQKIEIEKPQNFFDASPRLLPQVSTRLAVAVRRKKNTQFHAVNDCVELTSQNERLRNP